MDQQTTYETFLESILDDDGWYGEEAMQKDLEAGLPAEEVYKKATEWLDASADGYENDIREAFTALHKHGLPSKIIKEWVDVHKTSVIIYDIGRQNVEAWTALGINPEDYADDYLKHYGWYYLSGEDNLSELSPIVTAEKLISSYTMEEIISSWRYQFIDFIEDFTTCGGDLAVLAKKFFDEIGYDNEYREAIIDLIMAGADVDLDKFVACLDFSTLNDSMKECYVEILEDAGASAEMLAKFS